MILTNTSVLHVQITLQFTIHIETCTVPVHLPLDHVQGKPVSQVQWHLTRSLNESHFYVSYSDHTQSLSDL